MNNFGSNLNTTKLGSKSELNSRSEKKNICFRDNELLFTQSTWEKLLTPMQYFSTDERFSRYIHFTSPNNNSAKKIIAFCLNIEHVYSTSKSVLNNLISFSYYLIIFNWWCFEECRHGNHSFAKYFFILQIYFFSRSTQFLATLFFVD